MVLATSWSAIQPASKKIPSLLHSTELSYSDQPSPKSLEIAQVLPPAVPSEDDSPHTGPPTHHLAVLASMPVKTLLHPMLYLHLLPGTLPLQYQSNIPDS